MNDQLNATSFELHNLHLRNLRQQAEQRRALRPAYAKRQPLRAAFNTLLQLVGAAKTNVMAATAQRSSSQPRITGELARSQK